MKHRLAAIFAMDMVGYSRLVADDEDGTLDRQRHLQDTQIRPAIARHGGRIFKTTGDGLLAEFSSAIGAVKGALEIQQYLPEREHHRPPESRIRYRVGIHLGDVVPDETDILGDGVNIAARLEASAEPGGICISDAVYQNLQGKLVVSFEDGGILALKNMTRKVRVWRWSGPGTDGAEKPPSQPAPQLLAEKPSIAILPFTNLSGDTDQDYFAEGITEDIITELSRYKDLSVIAHNSSVQYRKRAENISEIAAKLSVQFIVEGSIRRSGSRIRVTTQLIEVEHGNHLWAERYDRDLVDIFDVQDELTQAIAAALPGRVNAAMTETGRKRPTENLTAYDHLLRGEWCLQRGGISDGDALAHFERAAEIDPTSARAHARIAAWHGYSLYDNSTDASEAIEKSRIHAEQALELDSGDARVHAIAASAYLHLGEFELTEQHMERAIALNPNDVEVLYRMGMAATYHGDAKSGLEWVQKSMRLDPLFPEFRKEVLFDAYYMSGDYRNATQLFRSWRQPPAHMYAEYAAALAQLDEREAAATAAATYHRLAGASQNIAEFVKRHLRICRLEADRAHWIDGYRKAGFEI